MTSGRWRWLLAAILIAATGAIGLYASGPSPPRAITLATGQAGGTYDAFGARYATRLGEIGIRTAVVRTNGSIDNLQRLLRGEVDAAFVQSGTYPLVADPEGRLRGIAAIYLEPLWVFHRGGAAVRTLSDLAGHRVSIGLPASGTEAVAAALLREHGIDAAGSNVARMTNAAAQEDLRAGRLHAVFFVTSYRDPAILDLLGRPDLTLHSFRRELAYTRRFPGLTPVKLGEGLLDISRNLPPTDTTLLAPAALLACRATLHPRVVEQILKIAQGIHGPGSLIDPPLRFPSRDGLDLPQHEAADVYLAHGESFASRTLPYPVLRWTPLVRVLVVSLVLWIPVVRFLPEVAGWRVNRRFGHLYSRLRDVERTLEAAGDAGGMRAGLAELDRLGKEAQLLCDKVPANRRHDAYDWRVHLSFVRSLAAARLAAMDGAAGGGHAAGATTPGREKGTAL